MNISSFSINQFKNINFNRNKTIVNFNNQLNTDCYVKTNNISFGCANTKEQREKQVDSFMKDLYSKLVTKKFSIQNITSTLQKHIKNIKVKSLSKAPEELVFAPSLQGIFCADMIFDEANNKYFYPDKNRCFYIKTETLNKENGDLEIFANSVHEFTHALQIDDTNSTPINLFNEYIQKHQDDELAHKQIYAANITTNKIEEAIVRPFIKTLIENENLSYDRLQRGQTNFVDWLCRKNKVEDFNVYIQEKVEEEVAQAEKNYGITADKELFIEATIKHFEREIEAYNNENKASKLTIKIENVRSLTHIQLYEKAIEALKQMKNK